MADNDPFDRPFLENPGSSINNPLVQTPATPQEMPVEEMTGGGGQQPQERTLDQFQPTNSVPPRQQGPLAQARQMYPPGNPQLPTILNNIGGEYVPQTGPTFAPYVRQQLVQQGYTPEQINQMQQGATTMPLAQAHNQRAQQLAQIQQQLQTQELSGHENSRLQQMRLGLSRVQEAVDNGTLSSTDGNNLFLQLQSGINPLQQRQQAAAAKAQELQNQQRQQEVQRQIDETNLRQQRRAQGLPENTGWTQLAPGIHAAVVYDDKGTPHQLDPRKFIHDGPSGHVIMGEGGATTGASSSGTGGGRGQDVTANRTAQVLQHVERSVDQELKAEFQNERPADYEEQRRKRIEARLPHAINHFRMLQQGLNPPPVDPRDQPLSETEGQRLAHLRGRYLRYQTARQTGERWPERSPQETQHWMNEMRTLEQRYGLQQQRGQAQQLDEMMQPSQERLHQAAQALELQIPGTRAYQEAVQTHQRAVLRHHLITSVRRLLNTKSKHTWTPQDTSEIRMLLNNPDVADGPLRSQLSQALGLR